MLEGLFGSIARPITRQATVCQVADRMYYIAKFLPIFQDKIPAWLKHLMNMLQEVFVHIPGDMMHHITDDNKIKLSRMSGRKHLDGLLMESHSPPVTTELSANT